MNIREKLYLDRAGLEEHGPITIVAFGDSVTHGALRDGEIDYDTVYWNLLRQKINAIRNYMPVNVINAGIGGINAYGSLDRIESQVLKHQPDLVIVCFGLNDVNGSLERYLSSLGVIFEKCQKAGAEVIFMTPNMLNTYVAEDTEPQHLEYAAKTAGMQNEGRMDEYMSAAVEMAESMGITVCDCYAEWKKLAESEDTTQKLVNRINHPTRQMHKLFADMLFDILFPEFSTDTKNESTMFNE
jgi:lysophospholipase L1-like esterase